MNEFVRKALGLFLCCLAQPTLATATVPLSLLDLVAGSDLVFEGTVVQLVSYSRGVPASRGTDIGDSGARDSVPPRRPDPEVEANEEDEAEVEEETSVLAAAPPGLPRSGGSKGGEMLFTEVTFRVDREILGSAGETVTVTVAGGVDGDREVVVFGIPRFALGERNVLFLRPGYEATANPVVGVGQGRFRIVPDPATGTDQVLDPKGNLVVGVADGRLAVRRNRAGGSDQFPILVPPPRPAHADSGVRTGVSAAFARYWLSDAPALSSDAFASAVRSLAEELQ